MLAKLALELLPTLWRQPTASQAEVSPLLGWRHNLFRYTMPLLALYVLAQPAIRSRLDYPQLQPFRDALATGDSMVDWVPRDPRYYEQLANLDESSRQLWETLMRRRIARNYAGADPIRPVKDFRLSEALPSVHLRAYDTDFRTNRWGLRDQDYEQARPAGTVRMALLGSSNVMGWGVRQEDLFETILEERLNREFSTFAPIAQFEILNFAFRSYSPLSQLPATTIGSGGICNAACVRALRFPMFCVQRSATPV
jgi:hypothetical protein